MDEIWPEFWITIASCARSVNEKSPNELETELGDDGMEIKQEAIS